MARKMKKLKSKSREGSLHVEYLFIPGEVKLLSVHDPIWRVSVIFTTPGKSTMIVREMTFQNEKDAMESYNLWKQAIEG